MSEQEPLVDLSRFLVYPDLLQKEATRLQRFIAWKTMTNRGVGGFTQYGAFFVGMWVYGLVEPERAGLIRSAYFWLRHIDDVADGDKVLPAGYKSKHNFLQRKIALTEQVFSGGGIDVFGDREDILLVDYYSLAKRLKIDLRDESLAILDTIVLDEERARSRRSLTKEELNSYFDRLDFACVGGGLKVAGETCDSYDLFSLSWAVRTMFNLRDFPKDFAQGIINISREDIADYGIDLGQLKGRDSVERLCAYDPMRKWYEDQVETGLDFLADARKGISEMKLHWVTCCALDFSFVGPTNRVLGKYANMLAALRQNRG